MPGFKRRSPWTVRNTKRSRTNGRPHRRSRPGRTMRGKRSSNSITTHDHDISTTYRYRRMPKFKRRRWRGFVQKVQAARATTAGLRSCGRTAIFALRGLANTQDYSFIGLYSYNGGIGAAGATGGGFDANDDMVRVLTNEDPTIISHKYMFQSGTMRMSLTSVDDTIGPFPAAPVIVHIYSLGLRDDYYTGTITGINPVVQYIAGYTDAGQIGLASKISAGQLISTPFNNPNFLRLYKVYKVQKVQLEPNEVFTWEFRDPKNHIINGTDVRDYGAKRGITKYWFFTVSGAPASTGQTYPFRVQAVVTKNYNYYELENNQVASGNV